MIYWSNWVTDNIGRFDKQHNKAMNEVRSGYGIDGKLLDIKSVTACPASELILLLMLQYTFYNKRPRFRTFQNFSSLRHMKFLTPHISTLSIQTLVKSQIFMILVLASLIL